MRFDHVIFDLDGTLLNTIDDLAAAGNYVCRANGWPTFSTDQYRYKVGNGMPKLVERIIPAELFGDARTFQTAFSQFSGYYAQHSQDLTAPYEDILPMLGALREAGTVLSVLTNKDHGAATPLVALYFGADTFQLVQGRIDAFPPKPEAPITQHVLAQLNADPARTLYVGDSNVDIETGHNAGLAACGVSWGFRGRVELEEAGADMVVDTPAELVDLVLHA